VADDEDEVTRLALAAKAGDREAASAFVALTYQQVQRFLGHLCHPRDVEDLTQETYLRAMHSLRRFAARSTARTWLLAIARHTAADHLRHAARSPRTTSLDSAEAVVGEARRQPTGFENEVLLQHLLDALRAERREAFVATQVLGLSYEEAAVVCGCPVGTIRSRVARARADLVAAYQHEPAVPQRRDTGT
jgi:RNA polymerase sigma-70 factor, ECF subfamily